MLTEEREREIRERFGPPGWNQTPWWMDATLDLLDEIDRLRGSRKEPDFRLGIRYLMSTTMAELGYETGDDAMDALADTIVTHVYDCLRRGHLR